MTGAATALSAHGVSVRIDRRTIVDSVDLEVDAGSVVGVVGPNGSGKSTLLRALSGLSTLSAGDVRIDGVPVRSMSARTRARAVSFVAQEEDSPADLLVHEYVALGRTPHAKPWTIGGKSEALVVDRALGEVGVGGLRDASMDSLSGGERRRVVLARGLAQDAGLLILDEPTNHLDIRHQLELLDLIRSLDRTVIVALHDLDLAASVCDRIMVLDGGVTRAFGSPGAVLTPEVLASVFGVQAFELRNPVTGRTHLVFESPTRQTQQDNSESAR
ncbi:iron complex transport system ATP-binding protein [Rhodococcus sp. 27YEA15]|uniref:ABC transporter ATP-binding protein n=1 Tax=Rhodococcus sp. 27YEA15 TaxID=3156259 RepID=UPI003C7B185A